MDARATVFGQQAGLDKTIDDRIATLMEWLRKNAPLCEEEQRQLDEGTAERAYWHYGYLTALRDVQSALRKNLSALN